ncbi:MAG: beta-ketoacyl-[acyl-carrier-protein] synthase family protein [Ruminococcus sp.]|nr:beta-ketoacyl-[acyl-carrier-protein] synthase family protein [Ruminococcus sp.]
MKKIVVTGMGAITSIGNSVDEYWNNLIAGKCGVKNITRVPVDEHDTVVAAEVDDTYETLVKKFWNKRQLNATTKAVRVALASAGEAVENSKINFEECDKTRVGVVYGVVGNSYYSELENELNIVLKEMPSTVAALVSMKYGLNGASFNLSSACSSSGYAIAVAAQFIESGMYDVVVVGGLSSMISHRMLKGFNQLLALSTNPDAKTACRPFTQNRDGFIIGEGAGTLVLESEAHAKKRNADIICSLEGYAMFSESSNLTAPLADGEGMAAVMNMALEKAGMGVDDIDYINAHGTSTILNDKYETMAIKKVFGEKAYSIPVSSTKSAIGHALGGASVLEAIAAIKAIETGTLPPTVNFDVPDPELDLDYVPNNARKADIETAMSNSFAFGGQNTALIFKKYRGV